MPKGRPSKYKPEFAEQAYKLCLLGATNEDMANFFEIDVATLKRWRASKEDFCAALKRGKAEADGVIAESLFHRAKGYSHPEDKIFQNNGVPVIVPTTKHYPPDTVAAIFWLKNRRPDLWRDKRDLEVTNTDEQFRRLLDHFNREAGIGSDRDATPEPDEPPAVRH